MAMQRLCLLCLAMVLTMLLSSSEALPGSSQENEGAAVVEYGQQMKDEHQEEMMAIDSIRKGFSKATQCQDDLKKCHSTCGKTTRLTGSRENFHRLLAPQGFLCITL